MNSLFPIVRVFLFGTLLLCSGMSQAAITLGGTRLVFSAPSKEASILVRNHASQDIMIQSWIDPDNADVQRDVPFAITPALSRLGANKQQLLRIFYYGKGADQDRESVYWLSVQEIPPKVEGENILQIALRQKIKVFYRPQGLPGSSAVAPKQLEWRLTASGLEVKNPSAFHVSLAKLKLNVGENKYNVDSRMIKPKSTVIFPVAKLGSASGASVEFEIVNDYGAIESFTSYVK